MTRRVLVLGGTTESRRLADLLLGGAACHGGGHDGDGADDRGSGGSPPGGARYDVVTSLAGRTADPLPTAGRGRSGGFGGTRGLARWLREHRVAAVVDATHPFAGRITRHAAEAAGAAGVPLLVLRRPGWRPVPGDRWHWVDGLNGAAGALPGLGTRAFLTTGRQGLAAFAGLSMYCLVRCVEPPDGPLPRRCEVVLARGPFALDGERELIARHRIDVLVTKDSGGPATAAKLTAAREAGLPVVVVRRPDVPPGAEVLDSPEAVAGRLDRLLG